MLDFINLYQRTYSNSYSSNQKIRGVIVPYGDYSYYLGSTISVFNPFWGNKDLKSSSNVVLIFHTNRIKAPQALILGGKKWKTPLGEINGNPEFAYSMSKAIAEVKISDLNVENELPIKYILPLIRYYNVQNTNIVPVAVSDAVSGTSITNILNYVNKFPNTYFIICGNIVKSKTNLSSQPIIEGIVSSLVDRNITKLDQLIKYTSFPNCFIGLIIFALNNNFVITRNPELDDYVFRIRSKRLLGAISFMVKMP